MKEAFFILLMTVWLLVGCAKPAAPAPAHSCPPVPQCRAEVGEIHTHADLLQGFVAYKAAFNTCQAYRNALAACVGQQ
ncbi:hypothetical protein CRG49_004040 [Neisseria sp. N95_16]|uniref:Uncharacterized protein n=1 Tax=Neisseria brasiliensis TaxID=2666100 RepID=A0A5Q3S0Y2_9NEIS|nr:MULTISPECIES: Rz1-like lysis system protein LysC [Neisseria]MRN37197.1 hypothetical protein [Neisseria brasiliensis]PJO10084.1 hypothetical protein CRG49_004040 [Neisseria sp. N95_16]PJO78748.1 hypothetical protein CWC45_03180 [Neisseria sp. N177_16]QGL24206.1 hypothetical protein GJV52_00750 [Neisseria brasiliensis]